MIAYPAILLYPDTQAGCRESPPSTLFSQYSLGFLVHGIKDSSGNARARTYIFFALVSDSPFSSLSPPTTISMSSPGKRKRAQPLSKVVLSEGSGDEAPIPSSSFWSSRQATPLFLPSSSDDDLARRRRNFEIIDYAEVLRLVPVDPQDPNPPIVRPPYVPPLPLPREAWPSVALPPPLPSVASSSVAGSSRAGRARRPSLGTQLHEQQFYGTPATSLPPSSPAVPVARDGPRRLDLSQLSARPRRRVPRSGPMGIAQNFPRPAETPRSPSPSGRYTPPTDSLSVLGAVSPQPPVVRLPPRSLAEIARAPTSPIPSLRSSPRDSARAPLGWKARPDRVIGMEAPPFNPEASRASPTPAPAREPRQTKPCTKIQPSPRKLQLRTMAVTPWRPVETPPPDSGSRSPSPFSEVDVRPPSVPAETRSESAHESFVTAVSPAADAEPGVATPVASPPPVQSEAAFRRGLIREANRLEREQLQRDLAEVDRIIRLREMNPPGNIISTQFPISNDRLFNSVACARSRGRRSFSSGEEAPSP
ncbi:hypothetical protein GGX14DRAFT_396809 [Mycena pura]|uniref:Uncharacterized protein n=1 Tax=Mycena pura TaxID=153505 RepID=A0AAD6V9X4_9AGAR|nr:hypothetical protein GGX14DRAFT_396809 [Mycena pura]